MPLYTNTETGETKKVARVRTYINDDGTKRDVDLTTGEDITSEWELVIDGDHYSTIAVKKAGGDGVGFR